MPPYLGSIAQSSSISLPHFSLGCHLNCIFCCQAYICFTFLDCHFCWEGSVFDFTNFTQGLSFRLGNLFFLRTISPVFVGSYELTILWPLLISVVWINWSYVLLSLNCIQIFYWEDYRGHVWGQGFGYRCSDRELPDSREIGFSPIASVTLITISCTTSTTSMSTSSITVTKHHALSLVLIKSNAVISHKVQATQAN